MMSDRVAAMRSHPSSLTVLSEKWAAEAELVLTVTGLLPQLRGIVRDARLPLSDMAVVERIVAAAEAAEDARVALREVTLR